MRAWTAITLIACTCIVCATVLILNGFGEAVGAAGFVLLILIMLMAR